VKEIRLGTANTTEFNTNGQVMIIGGSKGGRRDRGPSEKYVIRPNGAKMKWDSNSIPVFWR